MRLEILKQRLELYLDAERKILSGQSYRVGSRELTRANLAEVRAVIDDLSNQIDMADGSGRGSIRPVVF